MFHPDFNFSTDVAIVALSSDLLVGFLCDLDFRTADLHSHLTFLFVSSSFSATDDSLSVVESCLFPNQLSLFLDFPVGESGKPFKTGSSCSNFSQDADNCSKDLAETSDSVTPFIKACAPR